MIFLRLLIILLNTPQSFAVSSSFLPPNHLQITERASGSKITEAQFDTVIDQVAAIARPAIEAQGFSLELGKLWKNSAVNSEARQNGQVKSVNIFGGIARHSRMTLDALTLIVCHEFGHHLGGGIKMYELPWSSVEGQADYFATSKCARQVWSGDDNASVVAGATNTPASVTASCLAYSPSNQDQALCVRSQLASMQIALMLYDLTRPGPYKILPHFDTPDTSVVPETIGAHPSGQCRLDTLMAGALCRVSANTPFSDSDFNAGACNAPNETLGVRPSCWFAAP